MSTGTEYAKIPDTIPRPKELERGTMAEKNEKSQNYKGFVAGVFSGIAKLSGKNSLLFSHSPEDSTSTAYSAFQIP